MSDWNNGFLAGLLSGFVGITLNYDILAGILALVVVASLVAKFRAMKDE